MIRPSRNPVLVERHDDAGLPPGIVAALEREAAHLTRRDGRRRLIVRWEDEPPSIEEAHDDDEGGPLIIASIDIA